jgi:hypothetical protein
LAADDIRDATRPTLDDVIAVVEPGETVPYTNLIQRLQYVGRPTNGIGLLMEEIRFRGNANDWRGAEVVSFRTPYFDREAEGDWTEGMLYVIRREPEDDDD